MLHVLLEDKTTWRDESLRAAKGEPLLKVYHHHWMDQRIPEIKFASGWKMTLLTYRGRLTPRLL